MAHSVIIPPTPSQCLAQARAQQIQDEQYVPLRDACTVIRPPLQKTTAKESAIGRETSVQPLDRSSVLRPMLASLGPSALCPASASGASLCELYNIMRGVNLVFIAVSQVVSGSAMPSNTTQANAQAFPFQPTHLAKRGQSQVTLQQNLSKMSLCFCVSQHCEAGLFPLPHA